MSNRETPAGTTGGKPTVPTMDELPEKMRVHTLAKLLVRTSREVLAALADLGVEARGAQSSIDRKTAEQVVTALTGGAGPAAPRAEVPGTPATGTPATGTPATGTPATGTPAAESTGGGATTSAATAPAQTDPWSAAPAASKRETAPRVGAPLVPLFAPPTPLFQPPTRPARTSRRAAADFDTAVADTPDSDTADSDTADSDTADSDTADPDTADPAATADAENQSPARRRRTGRRATERPDEADVSEDTDADTTDEPAGSDGSDDTDEDGAARRRRRRGRRGRGRGRGGEGGDDEGTEDGPTDGATDGVDGTEVSGRRSVPTPDPVTDSGTDRGTDQEADGSDGEDEESDDGDGSSSRRRRRRRRRRGSGDDTADNNDINDDDPPGTVTRVRAPREPRAEREPDTDGDGVQSVRGSTRLEAKRQRRRDGRDAGRRRVPILSEAEFLARRESVDRTMVVRERGDRVEIGVLEDEILVEHFIADVHGSGSGTAPSMVGNIYLGRVQNVLPSMEAAFIDIGRGRNAVLYAGEVDWDAAGLGGKARRIEQALSSGDPVLVQVTKDPIGHKGARLTTQISLAGRFLVYVPSGGAAGISRKLPDLERKRLKDMLKEIVPSEAGVIIRTASEGVSHEALERDVRRLQAQWEVVETRAKQTGPNKPKAPVLLYEEPDLLIKVVRDQFNEDFSRLVVQGDDAFDTLSNYVGHVAPELADRMTRHVGTTDAFTEHRIDEQLLKALDRKVWLPSGGTLVIDRTEAMTVVDVNTGKFTGSGGNLEETVTRNNLEAAEEIVRQLRLRDIGGIIVIDFIDMVLEANRDLVLRRLTECLSRDRTRHQVAEVTSLGLVQMTRKRVGGGLLEHFSTPCEHCRGRGVIVSAEPVIDKGDTARPDEGSGRRSRRGSRRDDDRNGPDPRDEPGRGTQGAAPRSEWRNGRDADAAAEVPADVADASVEVGAPVAPGERTGDDVTAGSVEEIAVEQASSPGPVAEPAAESGRNGRPAGRRRGRVTRTAGAPAATDGDTAPAVVTVPAMRAAEAPAAAQAVAAQSVAAQRGSAQPVETQPVETQPVETQPVETQPVETQPEVTQAGAPAEPAPEPAAQPVATRARRARRAASRPAGPPATDPADAGGQAGADPV